MLRFAQNDSVVETFFNQLLNEGIQPQGKDDHGKIFKGSEICLLIDRSESCSDRLWQLNASSQLVARQLVGCPGSARLHRSRRKPQLFERHRQLGYAVPEPPGDD